MIYFVIGNFRGTFSSVNTLKGYMLTSWNVEGVHGQRKVGNPCSRGSVVVVEQTHRRLHLLCEWFSVQLSPGAFNFGNSDCCSLLISKFLNFCVLGLGFI